MTTGFSRRGFLSGALAALAAGPALAAPPERSLRPRMRGEDLRLRNLLSADALVAKAGLGGAVSFAVADAATGLLLEERASTTGLPPASVAKAITALYALDALGADYRFRTRLIGTGPVRDGVLQGDLVLAGSGDPGLDTDALAALAGDLKKAGIRELRGAFRVWGGALPYTRAIDPDQPEHVGYNPAICGLNLNYNRVHFGWTRGSGGYDVTMDARSARYTPQVTVARMAVVDRATPLYTYSDAGLRDDWTVARGALGKGGARWLPVRKPELYAGEVFQGFARANGLRLPAPQIQGAAPSGATLAEHASPPLRAILRDMLEYSTNITAEAVGMTATAARTGTIRSLADSATEMSSWARAALGMNGARLVDHSGLGEDSRLASRDMVAALVQARKSGVLPEILKEIVMRDSRRRALPDSPLSVRAKTGTLNFVSGLAGYITGPDGTEMAFAIFSADTTRRDALTRAQRERPEGGREWNGRARVLQQALIDRWGLLYAS